MKYFLFLDYDGTLTPIVKRPELAVLSKKRRSVLKRLNKSSQVKIAIVSGRKLSDVKKLIGLDNLLYAGNHGFEIKGPGVNVVHPQAKKIKPVLKKISALLKKRLKNIKGTIIENKGLSLSLHYRLVKPKDLKKLELLFKKTVAPFKKQTKITYGKKIFEVRPKINWHKGKAVLFLLKKLVKSKKITPVYIGDDLTDEDAFKALHKKGLTIRVGKSKGSQAKKFLKDVNAVYQFLENMLQ